MSAPLIDTLREMDALRSMREENAAMRKLIQEAEWAGVASSSIGDDCEPGCPWCGAEQTRRITEWDPYPGKHESDCPALPDLEKK
jgi:hypothetical protein